MSISQYRLQKEDRKNVHPNTNYFKLSYFFTFKFTLNFVQILFKIFQNFQLSFQNLSKLKQIYFKLQSLTLFTIQYTETFINFYKL